MTLKIKTGNKAGTGCMVLFALPFAAVGVGASGMVLWTILTWMSMQSWEEVPAQIAKTELVINHSSDGSTYNVKASYHYEWKGESYQGERVAISNMSDNIGGYHKRIHGELEKYYQSKKPFRCYVNPRNPAKAVLYRDLRIEIIGFMLAFALLFGGAGFGFMGGGIYNSRITRENKVLAEQYPNEPWLWQKEWHAGIIHSQGKVKMAFTLAFALFWNIVSLPVVLALLPGELQKENYLALFTLLFPLIGAVAAGFAIYYTLQWRRFGGTAFHMASLPGILGGRLHGLIRIPTIIMPEEDVPVVLECIRKHTSGSGKNRRTTESILWQTEKEIPKNALFQESRTTAIPVDIQVPCDQPASDDSDSDNEIFWRLRAHAAIPGVDYAANFRVPVFQTAESDLAMTTAALHLGPSVSVVDEDGHTITYYEPADAAQTGAALRKAGLRMEPCPRGGIAIVSPMLRQPVLAVGMLIFLAIWGGAIAMMIHFGAPILFPIVFGLFFLLTLIFVVDLWVGKSRIEITKDGIHVQGGPFGSGTAHHLPFDAIEDFDLKNTMQAGNKMYYTVIVKKQGGGKLNLINRLQQKTAHAVIQALRTAINDYSK
ncbi:MAG: DUF3592 domain-containing protein [Candidatus Hydrogenedentes bacterium]|nr:DUF3592 domain-containing protein [Candidatus Hydrogenedentota bacterium]